MLLPSPRAAQATTITASAMATNLVGKNSLPNEILSAICDYLPPGALTRVALVSHQWRANAERVLYSTILLHEVLPRASESESPPPTTFAPTPTPTAELEEQEVETFQTTTTSTVMMMPAVPITTLRCCETLSARPHLAEYVRRFHLRWETDVVESPLLLLRIAHYIAQTLVPTLVHLDSLELFFDLSPHFFESVPNNSNAPRQIPLSLSLEHPPQTPPPTPTPTTPPPPHTRKYHSTEHQHQHQHQRQRQLHLLLLPAICLPSLRTLSLRGIGTPPSLELERLLRSHPKLQHLRLSDYHRALHLSPSDVPHLRSFRGHPTTAASILPGRPVQALGLVGGGSGCESATEDDLARIAAGSIPVRALDLSGMTVTPMLLRSVSRHLSHVESLKVRLALWHTLHYALSGIRLLTALTTVLAAFYNLRGLDLSPTNAVVQPAASAASDGEQQRQNAAEEQHLCIAWMGACPSLRRVVFPSQTEWLLSEAGTWISESESRSRSRSPNSLPRCYLGASQLYVHTA